MKSHNIKKPHRDYGTALFVLMLISAAYYLIADYDYIGHNNNYLIYIGILPVLAGLLFIGFYRRKILLAELRKMRWGFSKFLVIIFLLLQGLVFSLFSFGLVAKVTWDILNKRAAGQSATEIKYCPITYFYTRKSSVIYFKYENRSERLQVNYDSIKDLVNSKADYVLKLTVRKGLWNYYIIESWQILTKK
ncbi:MAG: hypothetical protein M0D57_10045 [Sphingobacteriales bacterium JAD_PAG50586_3]|nr:MAG: hypothetical protein M0D57_10045 [Sphingobacteriales bacterium JAD_PAG50586_3]